MSADIEWDDPALDETHRDSVRRAMATPRSPSSAIQEASGFELVAVLTRLGSRDEVRAA